MLVESWRERPEHCILSALKHLLKDAFRSSSRVGEI